MFSSEFFVLENERQRLSFLRQLWLTYFMLLGVRKTPVVSVNAEYLLNDNLKTICLLCTSCKL